MLFYNVSAESQQQNESLKTSNQIQNPVEIEKEKTPLEKCWAVKIQSNEDVEKVNAIIDKLNEAVLTYQIKVC